MVNMIRSTPTAVVLMLMLAVAPATANLVADVDTNETIALVRDADVVPYPSYEQGFRWDYSTWERDQDHDRVDDLIEAVADGGLSALPRMSDGFLPFSARDTPGSPLLDLHIAYDIGVGDQDLDALGGLGLDTLQVDTMLPSVWAYGATPEQALQVASLDGVVMVELEQKLRALNNVARQATQVEDSPDYPNGVWDDLGYTGDGVGVAILDTGVDDNHAFLSGRFVAGADNLVGGCTANVEINPDDDNHVSVGLIGVGLLTYHGTHVAGTAVGHGALAVGGDGAGMAKGAELYDVKVLTSAGISCGNSVRNGLTWVDSFNQGFTLWKDPLHPDTIASTHTIDVVSMSLGGTCSDGSDGLSQTVDWLVAKGVTVVVAVGNNGVQNSVASEGCITSPSAAAKAISVGAYADGNTVKRDNDFVAPFSNCGPTHYPSPTSDQKKPDVTAPGVDIVSALGDATVQGIGSPILVHALSGTSMATPVVAGIVALMLEKDPTLTPAEVKDLLRDNAVYHSTGPGFTIGSDYESCWGFGQVNAYDTVLAV